MSDKLSVANAHGEITQLDIPRAIIEKAKLLCYDHERYFILTPETTIVAVARLVLSRMRPDGIVNAVSKMSAAFVGEHARREPVVVRALGKRYQVVDGNSTVTVAVAAGWPDIPCTIDPGP